MTLPGQQDQTEPGYHLKPRFLFIITLGAVFLVELLVMYLLHLLPDLSPPVEAFLDACLLSILVVPFLYFFFLKPLSRNIEERKLKEIERDQFEQIDILKNEFISTAAHELRTPVATIMGFTELLSDPELIGPVSEAQRDEFLGEIYENSERLNKLVDEILDISRIESGQKIPLDKKLLSTKEMLEKVVNRFKLKANHQLILDIRPGVPEKLEFDAHRIDQVLENLLSNAIKYSPKESTITIVVEGDDNHCKATIIDQGIGMTNEQKARMFDKFYRANNSNTAISGLGLGMSIVKQIIEDHGGTIRVDSESGKGTRVCFTLPA